MIVCFCGSRQFRDRRKVGGFYGVEPCEIELADCARCGAVRQITGVPDYVDGYHDRGWKHSFEEDAIAANLRLDKYGLEAGSRCLDVGCNNGAFVEEALGRGYDAWGVEPGAGKFTYASKRVYAGYLEDVGFPSSHFDAVTLHDVVEHVAQPLPLLKEVKRVLKFGGKAVVDVPGFFEPGGRKHWKKEEHLWFFTRSSLARLFEESGLVVDSFDVPIEGKLVAYGHAPAGEDAPVLVLPPGIGDIYWCLTKLGGLVEEMGWAYPVSAKIASSDKNVTDAYESGRSGRGAQYLIRDPRLRFCGYTEVDNKVEKLAYRKVGNVLQDMGNGSYMFSLNGSISPRRPEKHPGMTLEEVEPGWGVDYYPKLWKSMHRQECEESATRYEDCLVGYFLSVGFYQQWFSLGDIIGLVKHLHEFSEKRIVLLGAGWDREDKLVAYLDTYSFTVNLCGKTTLEMAQAIQVASCGVVGIPSGLTITGCAEGAKFACLWGDTFGEKFWGTIVPPRADYKAFDCRDSIPVESVGGWLLKDCAGK